MKKTPTSHCVSGRAGRKWHCDAEYFGYANLEAPGLGGRDLFHVRVPPAHLPLGCRFHEHSEGMVVRHDRDPTSEPMTKTPTSHCVFGRAGHKWLRGAEYLAMLISRLVGNTVAVNFLMEHGYARSMWVCTRITTQSRHPRAWVVGLNQYYTAARRPAGHSAPSTSHGPMHPHVSLSTLGSALRSSCFMHRGGSVFTRTARAATLRTEPARCRT